MSWSGGVFTRTNGTYTGSSVWANDEANSFDIESARHDTHDQDLATGINNCLTKDGQNSPSSHLNWVNTANFGTTGGSANAQTLSLPNAPATYYTGLHIKAIIGSGLTNTGALTLNVNGLGAKNVRLFDGSVACVGNECQAGTIKEFVYDGTQFLLVNPPPILDQASSIATNQINTTSGTFADMADTSVTVSVPSDGYYVRFMCSFSYSGDAGNENFFFRVDKNGATVVSRTLVARAGTSNNGKAASACVQYLDTTPATGSNTYKIEWSMSSGTRVRAADRTTTATVDLAY